MAVYTQVSAEALGAFLARYDVGDLVSSKGIAEGVENTNYLVETTKDRFVLTLYEKRVDVSELPYFMGLLDHLADKGLPVPPAIKDRNGVAIQTLEGRPACLIKFLSGVSLSHPTAVQARAAGIALGEMHRAAADFQLTRPNSMGLLSWRPLFERCGSNLDTIRPGVFDELRDLLHLVEAEWPADLPVSTVHADLFPDNVLMRGDRITGLIDFYFACTDFRAYDLAVTHSAWAFSADGTQFDAAVGHALVQGYTSVIDLTDAERAALPTLAVGACVRFSLSRAWDWLNTPATALVTRKDPCAYANRAGIYLGARETAFA